MGTRVAYVSTVERLEKGGEVRSMRTLSQVFYGKGPAYNVFHGSSLVESEDLAKSWVDQWRKKYFRISRESANLTIETFDLANLELLKVSLCKNLTAVDSPLEWQEDLQKPHK